MNHQTHEDKKYFNLQVTGIGYVNRIREVKVKRGDAFWACAISALHGSEDQVEYTYFDCKASGTVAEKLVKRLQNASDQGKKIMISFKLGDLYTDIFTYESGQKKGETGVSLKARLLLIHWIKVDGEEVYRKPPFETSPDESDTQQVPEREQLDPGDDQDDSLRTIRSTLKAHGDLGRFISA